MKYKNKKKHITALLAAMAVSGTSSVFAANFGDNLQDNNQAGTTYVSAQDGDTIRFGELNTSSGGGAAISNTAINPTLQGGGANLDYVYTSLNSVTPDQTTTLQGGLVIDPNTGNTVVAQGATQTASLSSDLIRVRRLEVYNQNEGNQALWGQAVDPAGVTQYGYVDANGNFVEVSLSGAAAAAFDTFVATPNAANAEAVFAALTPADITALGDLYSAGTLTPTPGTGNLIVEGATTTNGLTNTGALSTDSLTVGGVAAATVDDVAAETTARQNADAALQANIDTVQSNLDAETTRATGEEARIESESIARDGVLQTSINTVQSNLDAEVVERTGLIRNVAAGAPGSTQNQYDEIHIGANSLVTYVDSAAQQQVLTTTEANGIRVEGNLDVAGTLSQNGVAVATVDDVAAEAATRLAADTTLQANIDAEVAARIAHVNAEETRALAAEAVLAGRATALEGRATALEGRTTALEGRTTALEGRMGRAESDIRSLRKGIAMSAALQTPAINHGDNMAVKVGAATYDGEQGLGFGFAARVNESVTVNVDVATGFPETVARAGVNLSF